MAKPIFRSVKEAFAFLKIKDDPNAEINYGDRGITSLVMTQSEYHYQQNNWMTVYFLGLGLRSYYGGPAGNQYWSKQVPFEYSEKNKTNIPLFVKESDGYVTFIGYYRVNAIYKRVGSQGFSYFQAKLLRSKYQIPQIKLSIQAAN
jgi:hypothetical protein